MAGLHEFSPSPEPGLLHVVVESPRGATSKLKYDTSLGAFTLARSLPLGLSYPFDWGFVPGTRAEDGDPVDALLLSEGKSYPGTVIEARPLGLVALEQEEAETGARSRNDRLVALPASASRSDWHSFEHIPKRMREEIEQFFLNSVFFTPKNARVLGWEGPDRALAEVAGRTLR